MRGTAVSVRLVAYGGARIPDSALEALERAGITAGDQGVELLFFEQLTPELVAAFSGKVAACVALDAAVQREAMVPLLRAGALDVLNERASTWADRLRALLERRSVVEALMLAPLVRENVEGQSEAWLGSLRQAVELSQTAASVLISGETGTGKELLARVIHGLDPRPHKADLIVLDCTTLVAELSGSELFGHERGAFTGALTAREGVIAQAEGGTLFLDEVGELPLALQAQLLRVIQERSYRRVGADGFRSASFRLVCATHRDLQAEVNAGRFRADLYYRLAASTVRIPALRQRRRDILPLARFFLRHLSGDRLDSLDQLVEEHLLARDFPGNVRELKQLVGRAYHRWVGPGPVGFAALPEEEWGNAPLDFARELEPVVHKALAARMSLKEIGRVAQELAVNLAIDDAGGNLQKAAALLGVTDRALQIRKAQRADSTVPVRAVAG